VRVVALDPGGTTGWSRWSDNGGISWGQIGPRAHHLDLEKFLHQSLYVDDYVGNKLVVVCESFQNRANAAAELVSLEYIGVVRLFSQKTNTRLIMQDPGNMKEWCKHDGEKYAKLKANGWYVSGQPHATDANGHMLKYLVSHWGHLEVMQPHMQKLQELANAG
jgi:rhodanese-related sulfurtransferase